MEKWFSNHKKFPVRFEEKFKKIFQIPIKFLENHKKNLYDVTWKKNLESYLIPIPNFIFLNFCGVEKINWKIIPKISSEENYQKNY